MPGKLLLTGFLWVISVSSVFAADIELQIDDDGLISLRAAEATVEEVVTAVGDELGIAVSFPSPVQNRVNVDFQALKLEPALKQITSSYILVTGKKSNPPTVREIIVMPEGENSGYLPTGGNITEQNREADAAAGVTNQVSEQDAAKVNSGMEQVRKRLQSGLQEGEPPEDAATRLERGLPGGIVPPPITQ